MIKYLALLRGINISGRNKIAMPALREAFEKNGFTDVKTYINSGNVLFSSDIQDRQRLINRCEDLIAENFELAISVVVVAMDTLAATIAQAPDWWDHAEATVHYAIFMIPPMTVDEVFDAVGAIKPEYEKIGHHADVIFWSAPRKTFSKARWSKIASSTVNHHVTIRNANTVKKLLAMSE